MCLQRSAAVVYDSAEGVSAAMRQGSSGQLVQYELPLPEGPLGLKAWVAAHKAARPGNEELQKQVGRLADAGTTGHQWCEAVRGKLSLLAAAAPCSCVGACWW